MSETNFLEFLPLLCVSLHVTSPAVAEAAAAAAAPGIGLEQEPRSLLRSRSRLSVPSGRRSLEQAPPAGGRRRSPASRYVPDPSARVAGSLRPRESRQRRRPVPGAPGHAAAAAAELRVAVAPPVRRREMPRPL